jgi:hypothetical protein
MRFNYKRKTYPAVKIGDVFYVRDKDFLKSKCYKENKRLKAENEKLIKENEELKQKNKEAWLDYKDLRENYQTLDRAFDNVLFCKNNANILLKETFQKVVKMKCDLEKQLKHKNQLWKTAFKAYKNLKNKVENNLFPVEYIDFICATGIQRYPDEDRVVYDFSMPWCKVKKYLDKKYKRGEK